jgi:hypothetical protein
MFNFVKKVMSNTRLSNLVPKLQEQLGEEYDVAYQNNTLRFVIPEAENRLKKEKEFQKLIHELDNEVSDIFIDVIYIDEVDSGKTYRNEIVKDLKESLKEISTVVYQEKTIIIDVKRGDKIGVTLMDTAKAACLHTFYEVIKTYPHRAAGLKFRVKYFTGGFTFTITSNNDIVFETFEAISGIELAILSKLYQLPADQFHPISYIDGFTKDDFIFALEDLEHKEYVETQDFTPDTIVNAIAPDAPDNYPDIVKVKLLKRGLKKFL